MEVRCPNGLVIVVSRTITLEELREIFARNSDR